MVEVACNDVNASFRAQALSAGGGRVASHGVDFEGVGGVVGEEGFDEGGALFACGACYDKAAG